MLVCLAAVTRSVWFCEFWFTCHMHTYKCTCLQFEKLHRNAPWIPLGNPVTSNSYILINYQESGFFHIFRLQLTTLD